MPHTKKAEMLLCDKALCSKSYGFSSGHVWMWELDHKESWVLKNCCFWTVVLEKTLECPLDCHEIKPVHSKGNQSWRFIGRTDAEAEAPILWPVDVKYRLTGKDSDAEKDWSQEEQGTTENEMVGWHHRLDGHEFEQALWAGDGQGGLMCWGQWGCKESDTTEWLNWTQPKDLLYRTGNSAQCYLAAWTRGTLGGERICVFIWLRPVAVYLKLSPHCLLAILQHKIKNLKKMSVNLGHLVNLQHCAAHPSEVWRVLSPQNNILSPSITPHFSFPPLPGQPLNCFPSIWIYLLFIFHIKKYMRYASILWLSNVSFYVYPHMIKVSMWT